MWGARRGTRGQLPRVGAPVALPCGVDSVLWRFLLGCGLKAGEAVGLKAQVHLVQKGSKELVFPKTF